MAGEACNKYSGSAKLGPCEWVVNVSSNSGFVLILCVLEGREFGVKVEVVVQVNDLGVVVKSSVSRNVEEVSGKLGGADAATCVCEGFG